MRIWLKVAYDGSGYFGWQRQSGFITVQQQLEDGLNRLLGGNIEVRGSSRTDTGVHALGQGAVFDSDVKIPLDRLPYAVNSFLPKDIRVVQAAEVKENFHPQYSVIKKTYCYSILNSQFPNPLLRHCTEFVKYGLNTDIMKKAAAMFIGTRDFSAFCASGASSKTTIRTIYEADISQEDNIITFKVTGNGFLYNMVRIMAGTLIDIGRGRIALESLEDIIASCDRTKAGPTASPNGLVLYKIYYNDGDFV